jgi:hypothetical protein
MSTNWRAFRPELLLVAAILLLQALLLLHIGSRNSPVLDEVGHLTAGIRVWRTGRFDLYRVNPPLVRVIAAAPAALMSPAVDWSSAAGPEWQRREMEVGLDFLEKNGRGAFWYYGAARTCCIPLALLGAVICWRWSRALYGPAAGVCSCLMWTVQPLVLGWGATFTPDVAASSIGLLAGYLFWQWLRAPSTENTLLAATGLALAELTKMTWIVLFPLWAILWAYWRTRTKGPSAIQLVIVLCVALCLLNAGYGFSGTGTPLGNMMFISATLNGSQTDAPGNRFVGTLLERFPVPFPKDYLLGIDQQKADFERGGESYLLGEWAGRGWWYYYTVALLVKTPLGTLCSCALAATIAMKTKGSLPLRHDEIILLAPAITVFLLISSQTGFSRYTRYALPCVPFAIVFSSRLLHSRCSRWTSSAAWALTLWTVTSSALALPNSLSYFHELAGGISGGTRILLDSNVDWGQDLFRLNDWLTNHPNARPVYIAHFGQVSPAQAGLPTSGWPVGPSSSTIDAPFPPGWYAISRHRLLDRSGLFDYFQKCTPIAEVGGAFVIFRVPASEVGRPGTDAARMHSND